MHSFLPPRSGRFFFWFFHQCRSHRIAPVRLAAREATTQRPRHSSWSWNKQILQRCNCSIWGFPKIGIPQNGWFVMENPIKWMTWGYPYFWKHPCCSAGFWGGISCANQWPCWMARNNWSTTDFGGSEFQYPRPHTSSRRSTAGKASTVASMLLNKNCAEVRFCTFEIRSLLIPSRSPQPVRRFFWYGFVLIPPQGIVCYFHDHWFPPLVHAA